VETLPPVCVGGPKCESASVHRKLQTPLAVAVAVTLCYGLWAAWYAHHHPVDQLAHVSSFFQGRPGSSTAVAAIRPTAGNTVGYDGQFYLFIAADPVGARPYLDNAAYRYSRPLYPIVARAVSLGRVSALPWALVLIGIAAVGIASFALAAVVRRLGASPWYGALVGAYPGVFLAVSHDLAEPLAYAFVAVGLLAWPRRTVPAAILFALAGLTRETTLVFPVVLGLWLLLKERRRRDAALMLGISLIPYVVLKLGLGIWLGHVGAPAQARLEPVPFLGLLRQWPWTDYDVQQLLAVVLPALLAVGLVWWSSRRLTLELCLLAANVLALVVFLPQPTYVNYLASGRVATGAIVAFVLCIPALLREGRVAAVWLPVSLWLLPWYTVLPEAVRR
jgi:hypothetical protein